MTNFIFPNAGNFLWRATLRRCSARMRVFCFDQRRSVALQNGDGQALVEFTLILFVIMALCSGMLYVSRLLTFDYWAEQEARYIAFEQTWVPYMANPDPDTDPVNELDNGRWLRRPEIVDRLDAEKGVKLKESLDDIIIARRDTTLSSPSPEDKHPILLARVRDSGFISNAFASMRNANGQFDIDDAVIDDRPSETPQSVIEENQIERTQAIIALLRTAGFGDQLCSVWQGLVAHSQLKLREDCSSFVEAEFGAHLAEHTDFKALLRDYGLQIRQFDSAPDALQSAVTQEVASQFYSFFDRRVLRAEARARRDFFSDDAVQPFEQSLSDEALNTLSSQLSLAGVDTVANVIQGVRGFLINAAEDPQQQLFFEQMVTALTHGNFEDRFGLDNVEPLPSRFDSLNFTMQAAVMTNVLHDQYAELAGPLLQGSAKKIEVHYNSERGLFSAAQRNLKTENVILSRTFFLVTQPWHIPRRSSADSAYRLRGNEFEQRDSASDSEEAELKRRVNGLWVFPSSPGVLFSPLYNLDSVGELGDYVQNIDGREDDLVGLKDFFVDGPIVRFLGWFEGLDRLFSHTFFGHIIPTLPAFPPVRPDAYPGSNELAGNDGSGIDKSSGGKERTFADYITEQREYKCKWPNPVFNGDIGDKDLDEDPDCERRTHLSRSLKSALWYILNPPPP